MLSCRHRVQASRERKAAAGAACLNAVEYENVSGSQPCAISARMASHSTPLRSAASTPSCAAAPTARAAHVAPLRRRY